MEDQLKTLLNIINEQLQGAREEKEEARANWDVEGGIYYNGEIDGLTFAKNKIEQILRGVTL